MLTDPTTIDPGTGERYKRVLPIPILSPTTSITLAFELPYNVYNLDASIVVEADYINSIPYECDEGNNSLEYHSQK